MTDFDAIDFFTDESMIQDPWPYFAHLRDQCPVQPLPHHDNVLAVTGYDEAAAVYRDHSTFSSCVAVLGPFPPLPFEPVGDDLRPLIEEHRADWIMGDYMIALDPPHHTAQRSLLARLLTPRRLKENEAFMWSLAAQHIDEFVASGSCELMNDFARPFTLLVIADLLGVPESDHELFRSRLGAQRPGQVAADAPEFSRDPLQFLNDWFTHYIVDRRREPQHDVLTGLATATLADGSLPDVAEVVRVATFLFGAGQDTTARLITTAMRLLADDPALQQVLRDDRSRIADLVEEVLRIEGVIKTDFRLASRPTSVGGVDVPAGTIMMISPCAVNRDPRHFEQPDAFDIDRPNARDHLAFGRGIHTCPGASLARTEAKVSIELLLDRLGEFRISDAEHGPAGDRHFAFEPTYILPRRRGAAPGVRACVTDRAAPYRVAQWATGNIGTRALRHIIEHPSMELTGVYVYDPTKVGRDAGELCGLAPVGVAATDQLATIIATRPDCVLYMPRAADVDVICRAPHGGDQRRVDLRDVPPPADRAGRDPPAGRDGLRRGQVVDPQHREQPRLHHRGGSPRPAVDPARPHPADDRRVRRSLPAQLARAAVPGDGVRHAAGRAAPGRLEHGRESFGPSLRTLADAIGIRLDRLEAGGEVAVAPRTITIAAGTLEAGTVAAQRISVAGIKDGRQLLRFRATWYCSHELDPAWDLLRPAGGCPSTVTHRSSSTSGCRSRWTRWPPPPPATPPTGR